MSQLGLQFFSWAHGELSREHIKRSTLILVINSFVFYGIFVSLYWILCHILLTLKIVMVLFFQRNIPFFFIFDTL